MAAEGESPALAVSPEAPSTVVHDVVVTAETTVQTPQPPAKEGALPPEWQLAAQEAARLDAAPEDPPAQRSEECAVEKTSQHSTVDLVQDLVKAISSIPGGQGLGATGEEEDNGGAAAAEGREGEPRRFTCRPLDLFDYWRRLRTFRPGWWFNKPVGVSPIECARRGWAALGVHVVVCECCGAELRITREAEVWLVNGAPSEDVPSRKLLVEGHSAFCPWRAHEVSLADPGTWSDREIVESVDKRLREMQEKLSCIPALTNDPENGAANTYEVLSRAGWGPSAHAPEVGDVDLLQCFFCLRCVAVQSFPHWPVSGGRGELGEPPAKAARQGLEDGRLWTPRDSSGRSNFEPHALHRFFCPMFSPESDDLSPNAVRMIIAREAAAMTAERKSLSETQGDKEAAGFSEAAGAAAACAQELIRSLFAILPPQ